MYYPKQIPYLLTKEFQEKIEYMEYNIKELNNYCMCIWTMKSKTILEKTIYNHILPDACIDIIIDIAHKTIHFAGFSKETKPLELNGEVAYLGVRLKPGAFYTLFHIESDKIMDHLIPFSQIEKDYNLYSLFIIQETEKQIEYIKNYLVKKIQNHPDTKFIQLVDQLYQNPKEQNVITLAQNLGYNQRHLVRIFKTQYGISPKVLLNIVRLHLCLTLLLDEKMELVAIATLCGFYDQSHFIKEIKRYTGISPLQLIEIDKN